VSKKRNQKKTFSEIVAESESSPSKVRSRRVPPGVHDEFFVDQRGMSYILVEEGVTPTSATRHVAEGTHVVFDECGCGGTCGLQFSTPEVRIQLAKSIPTLETDKGQTGSLSLWKSDNGNYVLLARGPVRWT
jgi:hypothetical protein